MNTLALAFACTVHVPLFAYCVTRPVFGRVYDGRVAENLSRIVVVVAFAVAGGALAIAGAWFDSATLVLTGLAAMVGVRVAFWRGWVDAWLGLRTNFMTKKGKR